MTQTPADPPAKPASKVYAALAILAALLFLAGAAASFLHAPAILGLSLRCAAIALMLPVALRRRSLLVARVLTLQKVEGFGGSKRSSAVCKLLPNKVVEGF